MGGASGAMRHGAECFNYYFPQHLDEEFMIIWDGLPDDPWVYVKEKQLRGFLFERVAEGFTFPLNPKWVTCDPGWYELFMALRTSKDAAAGVAAWFPPSSGLLEKIDMIHRTYPGGYAAVGGANSESLDADMAEFQLRRYLVTKRAKTKLRMIFILGGVRRLKAAVSKGEIDADETATGVSEEAAKASETQHESALVLTRCRELLSESMANGRLEAALADCLLPFIKDGRSRVVDAHGRVSVEEKVTILGTGKHGIVRFIGPTSFADGDWVGVELAHGGKNNGTVKGIKYFECPNNSGLFVRESHLQKRV